MAGLDGRGPLTGRLVNAVPSYRLQPFIYGPLIHNEFARPIVNHRDQQAILHMLASLGNVRFTFKIAVSCAHIFIS
jgi:hypothetical protein